VWKEPSGRGVQGSIDTRFTASPTHVRSVAEFEGLLRANDRQIRSLAYRLVGGGGGEVDDVLQQAYLKAFVQWPSFRGDCSFTTWLHRIAYTTALDHLRSKGRRERLHQRAATTDSVRDRTDQVVDHLVLERALDELPVDQRVALLLVDGQGMSYDDAAHVLDVAPGTIASRLHRARATVRARLTQEGAR